MPSHPWCGVGFDYVHSVVDDHSRLAHSQMLPDENGITCMAFLEISAALGAARSSRPMLPAGQPLDPARALQQSTTPLSHRRPTPDQPNLTNLTAGYTYTASPALWVLAGLGSRALAEIAQAQRHWTLCRS